MNVRTDSSDKKQCIYRSTLCLVGQKGFHGSPMSQIAREAGVAAGTIYHYFPSKEALIFDLFEYVRQAAVAAMFKSDNPGLPFQSRFFDVFVNLCRHYIENPDALRFLEQYSSSPFMKCNPAHDKKRFNEELIAFFHEGINAGAIKALDDRLLAPVFHGTVISSAKYHITGRYNFSDESLRDVAQIIWDGIKIPSQDSL